MLYSATGRGIVDFALEDAYYANATGSIYPLVEAGQTVSAGDSLYTIIEPVDQLEDAFRGPAPSAGNPSFTANQRPNQPGQRHGESIRRFGRGSYSGSRPSQSGFSYPKRPGRAAILGKLLCGSGPLPRGSCRPSPGCAGAGLPAATRIGRG